MSSPVDISIVIPSAGAPAVFTEVLDAVFAGVVAPCEVIVVDDAMDENAYRIVEKFATEFPIRVLPNRGNGVSAARNAGAREASGNILLFIDTDVVLHEEALAIISKAFQEPDIEGVVGVQSADLRYDDFFSRWKNHWMRYTYRRLTGDIHLFYTSCAAIRRESFLKTAGFDEKYKLPSIEDTVFGAELGVHQIKIKPVSDFEIEHVKGYDLAGVLKTDRKRSAALVKYTLRNLASDGETRTGKTSVPFSFILGSLVMIVFWFSAMFGMVSGADGFYALSVVCLVVLWSLNIGWLRYLYKEEGLLYLLGAMLFLPLDVTWVDIGMIQGTIEYFCGSKY